MRARRWWQTGRRIRTIERAAAFVDDVGFALLFGAAGIDLPSLWDAAGDRPIGELGSEWWPDIERVWRWKDDLPLHGLAWYGRFLRGRPSFLSLGLLTDLYPRSGDPGDFAEAPLDPDARRVAEVVLLNGPTSAAALREVLGLEGRRGQARFNRALADLGRKLVLTNFGVEERVAGWPSAVLELTARAFPIRPKGSVDARRLRAAARFLGTMVRGSPAELGRAFGWPVGEARAILQSLVDRGEARVDGPLYAPTHRSGTR